MSFDAFSFDDDPPRGGSLPSALRQSGTPSSADTASWSFVSSRVTGGVSGSGRVVLEVDGDPRERWCCGTVSVRSGGSKKFCTLPVGTCTVQAHQSGRTKVASHEVKGSAFYIQASEKTALLVPYLDKSLLSAKELMEIRGQEFSAEQWIQLFGIIQAQAETRRALEDEAFLEGGNVGGVVGENLVDVQSLAARVERAADFQTPRKPALPERTVTMKVELTRFDEVPGTGTDVEAETLQDLIGSNWNKLVGVVGTLEAALPMVQTQLMDLYQGLSVMVEGVEDKANALGIALGQGGRLLDAEGTVWDAIAKSFALGSRVEDITRSVASDLVAVDKTVSQLDKSFQSHVGDVLKVVGQIHGGHKRLQDRVVELERVQGEVVAPSSMSNGGLLAVFTDNIPGAVADELSDLCADFDELRGLVQNTSSTQLTHPGMYVGDQSELHERLQKVEMRATGESFISDQRVFASYEDVLNWVQGSSGRSEIQVYWDVFSLLSKTRDATFLPADYLEGALMSERLQQNPLASLVMACLQIEMPAPFLTKKAASTGTGSGAPLPTIKTFDNWTAVQSGFNAQLNRAITTEVGGLRRMMGSSISKQDHKLSTLATHLLTNAQYQWQSMAGWITEFYHRLFGEGGLTSKESWLIVGNSVQAIFMLIHRTRSAGHDSMFTDDKSVKAAHLLWAVMQTH